MEHEEHLEEDFIENDITKIMIDNLHELGYKAEKIEDIDGPYYSYYFSGASRIAESVCCIKIEGLEFDCMQILIRG
ncbi:MAG: hypothetical protein QW416_01165 [Candidatus Nitrosocaldaceae archaeon]